jgi:heat-inducible transcriptional repressor
MHELTPRRQRILRSIVEEYVSTAQPVGSELIARKYEEDLSSATVRNEMVALESLGLINQPHTSSGRVPTERGYRLFVERLMQTEAAMTLAEQRSVRQQLHPVADNPDQAAHMASSVLARLVRNAAVASPPTASRPRLRRVELVPLDDAVVLVTLILQSGAVRQVVQQMDAPVERDELVRLSNQVTDLLANKTASQAKRVPARLDGLAQTFATVAARALQQTEDHAFAAVYYEGLALLLAQPEFAQSEKLRPIVEVLEQQSLLTRFLADSMDVPGVQIMIGAENPLVQMRGATVVVARYGAAEDAWGVLGVVGPTRMAYWRVVPMVRFMADLMEVLVQDGGHGAV